MKLNGGPTAGLPPLPDSALPGVEQVPPVVDGLPEMGLDEPRAGDVNGDLGVKEDDSEIDLKANDDMGDLKRGRSKSKMGLVVAVLTLVTVAAIGAGGAIFFSSRVSDLATSQDTRSQATDNCVVLMEEYVPLINGWLDTMLVREVNVPLVQVTVVVVEVVVVADLLVVQVGGVVTDTVLIKTPLICLTVLGVMVELDGYGKRQEITVVVEGRHLH